VTKSRRLMCSPKAEDGLRASSAPWREPSPCPLQCAAGERGTRLAHLPRPAAGAWDGIFPRSQDHCGGLDWFQLGHFHRRRHQRRQACDLCGASAA
jgi:hypothetical protein